MNWLEGSWEGLFTFRGLENYIIISYTSFNNQLILSFPYFKMNNIKIISSDIFESFIQFKIFNNQNYGIIIIKKSTQGENNHLKCIYISPNGISTNFECKKMSKRFIYGIAQYGPTPLLSDLKKLLNHYYKYECDELKYNIEYPNINHPLYKDLKKILPFQFNEYNLNEFKFAVKILRWINISFGTGEMIELPPVRDAYALINKKDKKLNCRGYSILLNDIFNSFGVKTRMIRCNAFNIYDLECHYVNEIFCDEWNKWILLDAAFGCFITNDNNVPLNLYEVRKNIIINKSMILKAGLNTIRRIDECNYWYGLIKNIFRITFYSNYNPGFDNDNTMVRYIEVIPKEYDNSRSIIDHNRVITTNICYYY